MPDAAIFPARGEVKTFIAGADLSGNQFYIVKADATAGQVVLAADGEGFGVLMNTPESGDEASVCIAGYCRVKTEGSATFADGAFFASAADGTAEAAASGNTALGRVWLQIGGSTPSTADDVLDCELGPFVVP